MKKILSIFSGIALCLMFALPPKTVDAANTPIIGEPDWYFSLEYDWNGVRRVTCQFTGTSCHWPK